MKAKLSEEQLTMVIKTMQDIRDAKQEDEARWSLEVRTYSKRVRELQTVIEKRNE